MNNITDKAENFDVPLNIIGEDEFEEFDNNNQNSRIKACFSSCMDCLRETCTSQLCSVVINRLGFTMIGMGLMSVIIGFDQGHMTGVYSGMVAILGGAGGVRTSAMIHE